jgi:hypothetical protein
VGSASARVFLPPLAINLALLGLLIIAFRPAVAGTATLLKGSLAANNTSGGSQDQSGNV